MGLLDRFRAETETEQTGYEAVEVNPELADALTSPGDRDAISVRPNKSNGGIEAMTDVLESLHAVETESGLLQSGASNISPAHSFEMRYSRMREGGDRVMTLQYLAGDDRTDGTLERQLRARYPDSQLGRSSSELFPDVDTEGRYIAGATLNLRRYTLYPIKNIDLPGFNYDPTGSILEEMVGAQDEAETDADVVVQIQFKPAERDWTHGVSNGHGALDAEDENVRGDPGIKMLAKNLRQPTYSKEWRVFTRETVEYPPSKVDKQVAKLLEEQQGEKGWRLCLRVFAISDDPDVAVERASHTAGMFRNFYENNAEQTFIPEPLAVGEIEAVAQRAAEREWHDRGIVKAQREAAGVLNIPEAKYVATNKMNWTIASPGDGIPPGTPRFDYAAAGVDPGTASREEVQVAMLDAAGPDEPLWYGTGVKHGTEAGVFPDTLYHQFLGGKTRTGKTTMMTNFTGQRFRTECSGLIVDPKGKDLDDFLAEWPRDRPVTDLVVMDLSDQYDRVPRFNFMEIPEYLEPGTRSHTSYCEALAEDIIAMVAEAGGSDKYMGALMKRVVKTVVRGLAKADQTATLLDVAAVCASSDNLSRFRERMGEERFDFLRDTAERLEARDDTDLEPLAGRMDEWVLNDNVRELICARESSFSINDLVREGRWMAVRFDKASSETEMLMVGTALIRRTYFAQRHLDPGHKFDLVCDEFDNIASEESNIDRLLSEAAAFGYRCTLACQAPTNQLPERVRNAIENQCGTFVSFNPGGGKEARWIAHQHTVDADELLDLPRYKFFLRATTQSDDLTHSYMVEGFPPAREARDDPRTEAEIRELTEASLDEYGAPVESAAEQRAASPYIDGQGAPTADGSADGLDVDAHRDEILAAVFGALVTAQDPDAAGVPTAAVLDTLRRRLDVDGQNVDTLIQRANAQGLVEVSADGERIDLTADGRTDLFDSGTSANAGGIAHQAAMEPIAAGLARVGYDVSVPRQTGDEMPDLRATPPVDQGGETFAEARAARDDLKEQYPAVWSLTGERDVAVEYEKATLTAPAQIGHNLRKGVEDEAHVLFVVPPGGEDEGFAANAETLAATLSEPMLTWAESRTPAHVDARYYHQDEPCLARATDDPEAYRVALPDPDATPRWVSDDSALLCLRDGDGTEYARFEDLAAWRDRDPTDFPVVYRSREGDPVEVRREDGGLESYETLADVRDEYRAVAAPYLPAAEFDGDLPVHDEDYSILILPTDDQPLQRYAPEAEAWFAVGEAGGGDEETPPQGATEAGESGSTDGSGSSDDGLFSGSLLD